MSYDMSVSGAALDKLRAIEGRKDMQQVDLLQPSLGRTSTAGASNNQSDARAPASSQPSTVEATAQPAPKSNGGNLGPGLPPPPAVLPLPFLPAIRQPSQQLQTLQRLSDPTSVMGDVTAGQRPALRPQPPALPKISLTGRPRSSSGGVAASLRSEGPVSSREEVLGLKVKTSEDNPTFGAAGSAWSNGALSMRRVSGDVVQRCFPKPS